jgi:Na+-driven multidrug efflux pump
MGSVFQFLGFGLNGVIRAAGNPRVAMLTMILGNLLNLILAPILLFVFGLGMRGAAIATVVAQAISAAWVVSFFLSRHSLLRYRWKYFRLEWPVCLAIASIGSSHFAMQLVASGLNVVLNNQLFEHGGDLAISVWGVLYVAVMLVAMPIFGICQGAQPIIGYNYGAQRFDRVLKTLKLAVLSASVLSTAGFAIAMCFPSQIIRIFNPEDQALVSLGTHAMRICVIMMPVVGFQIVSSSYFQAVGKPRQAMFLMLSRQMLFLIPAVVVLPRFFGLDGVWFAMPTADAFAACVTAVWIAIELRHLRDRHAEIALLDVPVLIDDR